MVLIGIMGKYWRHYRIGGSQSVSPEVLFAHPPVISLLVDGFCFLWTDRHVAESNY